uniref:ribbon-helix-helix protein, CopG family n=1 Tax=Methylobacterium sp. NMS12 TaxID=3079766 RepID=UPI003F884E31
MLTRPRLDQADRIASERLQIAVPLNLKTALADMARRQGKSVSGLMREAAEDVVERGRTSCPIERTTR